MFETAKAPKRVDVVTLEIMKRNLINVAKEHKEKCSGENCNISLFYLQYLGEQVGMTFTPEEEIFFL